MRHHIAVSLCVLVVGACNSMPTEIAEQTAPDQVSIGRPITTNIPTGIYTGEISNRYMRFLNGVLQDDTTTIEPYQEAVDENGLPLIFPAGEAPVEGLVLINEIGFISSELRIGTVSAIGDRLFIAFDGTSQFNGIEFVTTGTWTYEFIPPNQLDFIDQRTTFSITRSGDTVRDEYIGLASLTR